jgi:hypothetical protein
MQDSVIVSTSSLVFGDHISPQQQVGVPRMVPQHPKKDIQQQK